MAAVVGLYIRAIDQYVRAVARDDRSVRLNYLHFQTRTARRVSRRPNRSGDGSGVVLDAHTPSLIHDDLSLERRARG